MRSFGFVDEKVKEAEFFLGQLTNCQDFFAAQCFSVAFAASTRSITFAMQSSITGLEGFDVWYAAKQADLKADPLARFFHEFRRVSQHIGDNLVGGGSYGGRKTLFYFVPVPDLATVPNEDVVTASRAYFLTLLRIVFDCYQVFGPHIDAHQHYTQEHYTRLGLTIEDAEEKLGFPRGWTDIGDPNALPWRWQAIRNTVSGCTIQDIFYMYLNQYVRTPKPLKQYKRKAS